jgi:hypothetical protein
MSDRLRIGAGIAVVAAAVVLFVVLSDDDGDSSDNGGASQTTKQADSSAPPKAPPIPVIRLRGGEPVGGVQDVEVTSGERARFKVTSDTEGDVHVHGYDVEKPVEAGGSVRFDFPADLEGGYEIELHHGGGESQIAELTVQPG